ncbi:hypothetical protein ALC57_13967 [Trachymyrmex cornetzi]|uniref:Uncharacterized protein n=1 Tax=Trachymyrmex cornetzi TaxID=471704 RepID=A0A195DLY8_9HYME|nr:hypothetical protein ALC57_13967 [Trachymyrmex cornetzi]
MQCSTIIIYSDNNIINVENFTLSPSEISVITLPSAGFIVGNLRPLVASTNSLSMNSYKKYLIWLMKYSLLI